MNAIKRYYKVIDKVSKQHAIVLAIDMHHAKNIASGILKQSVKNLKTIKL